MVTAMIRPPSRIVLIDKSVVFHLTATPDFLPSARVPQSTMLSPSLAVTRRQIQNRNTFTKLTQNQHNESITQQQHRLT